MRSSKKRSSSTLFLQTPCQFCSSINISGGVGKDREWFTHFPFATAHHKCKISSQKVNRACYCVHPYSNWYWRIFSLKSISIGKYTVSTITRALRGGDPTFLGEVAPLRGAVRKRLTLKHSRSFPTLRLMSGDDRKRCKPSRFDTWEKRARFAWKIYNFPELGQYFGQRHHIPSSGTTAAN